MPKKISMKCSVFLQLIILHPHSILPVTSAKKSAKPSAFYTFENSQIRKSAFYRRPRPDGSGRLLVGPQHCTRFGDAGVRGCGFDNG